MKKYEELSQGEIKEIVVEDKWMLSIADAINTEMDRISHRLATRIKELSERYEQTLFEIERK